jgi:hypothetical protein
MMTANPRHFFTGKLIAPFILGMARMTFEPLPSDVMP